MDLHRDSRDPAGHVRDVRRHGAEALRRLVEGSLGAHRRYGGHGRSSAFGRHDERGRNVVRGGGRKPRATPDRDVLLRPHDRKPRRGTGLGSGCRGPGGSAVCRPRGQLRGSAAEARRAGRHARHRHGSNLGARPATRIRAYRLVARGGYCPEGVGPGGVRAPLHGVHARALRGDRRHAGRRRRCGRLREQPARLRAGRRFRQCVRVPWLRARIHQGSVLRRERAVPLGRALRRCERHPPDGRTRARDVPRGRTPLQVDPARTRKGRLSGAAVSHLLVGAGGSRSLWKGDQRPGRRGRDQRAHRHRARPPGHRVSRFAWPRDRGDEGRHRRCCRLADPERAAQHRVGRKLGLVPPRRRCRHRQLASRGAGDCRGRHAGDGGAHREGSDQRSWHWRGAARGRGL